jgi:hypothetical protein
VQDKGPIASRAGDVCPTAWRRSNNQVPGQTAGGADTQVCDLSAPNRRPPSALQMTIRRAAGSGWRLAAGLFDLAQPFLEVGEALDEDKQML